jgi:acyl-CoA reductase-like NAD-dependent aldehyde dehydrogenase
MATFGLLVDGSIVTTQIEGIVVNPSTEAPVGAHAVADEAMLGRAVQAAKRAQPGWAALAHAERKRVVLAIADLVAAHSDELARLVVQEQGKPLAHAVAEIAAAVHYVRYYAGLEMPVRVISETASQRVEERRYPLGVVAGIVPWNFPFLIAVYKLAPAMLAGNAVIVKPAPTTPLSLLRFGEIVKDAAPAGVLQILADDGELGPLISAHPDIAKISFTGSTATGKAIARAGADTLKRLTLELGGNDAAIVLDDVDLDKVAPQLFMFAFANAGQVCVSIKRLYAHARIYDDLCARLAKLAEAAIVGDGFEQGVQIGPVQNRREFERVLSLIEDARESGGRILAGGTRVGERGFFIKPVIVADIPDDARLVREEAFGPVRPVLKFEDVEDAIARANNSPYGLGASVWSSNPERALAIAERLEAGTVWINRHMAIAPDIPVRGSKQSGLGVENALEGFLEYTAAKVINIAKAT